MKTEFGSQFPEDIRAKIESFALVIDNSGNKSYVAGNKEMFHVMYFSSIDEMDQAVAGMGLERPTTTHVGLFGIYDPMYPYSKKPAGEKRVGYWYPAGKVWAPGQDRTIRNGHPAERIAAEWMKAHPVSVDDVYDGVGGAV